MLHRFFPARLTIAFVSCISSLGLLAGPGWAQVLFKTNVVTAANSFLAYDAQIGAYEPPFNTVPTFGVNGMAANDADRVFYAASAAGVLYTVSYDPPYSFTQVTMSFGAGVVQGLAYDTANQKLWAYINQTGSNRIVMIDPATGDADLVSTWSIGSLSGGSNVGGIDYDADTGIFYLFYNRTNATAEGPFTSGRGLYSFDPVAQTVLFIAAPPIKTAPSTLETDIDGVAAGGGYVYLCADEVSFMYPFNLATMSYETPISQTPGISGGGTTAGAAYAPRFFFEEGDLQVTAVGAPAEVFPPGGNVT